MNFEIKKNDLGYYGVFEVETKKEIIPCLFKDENELKSIKEIQKVSDDYYTLISKAKEGLPIYGSFDRTSGNIVIPTKTGIKCYTVSELESKIIRNDVILDNIKIKKIGNYLTEIKIGKKSFPLNEAMVDEYELLNNNQLIVFKSNNEIVKVFDISRGKFLNIYKKVSNDVVILEEKKNDDLYFWSICDLKNKKFLKNVFEKVFKWYEGEMLPGYDEYNPRYSHERMQISSLDIFKNEIRYHNKDNFNSKLYDINNGILIENYKSFDEKNGLYFLEYEPSILIYNKNIGEKEELIPINFSSDLYDSNLSATIYYSAKTKKYYFLKSFEFEQHQKMKPLPFMYSVDKTYFCNGNLTKGLQELETVKNRDFNVVKLPNINIEWKDYNISLFISENGTILGTSDEMNAKDIVIITDELIEYIIKKLSNILKNPEIYNYVLYDFSSRYSYILSSAHSISDEIDDKFRELLKNIKSFRGTKNKEFDIEKIEKFKEIFLKKPSVRFNEFSFCKFYLVDDEIYGETTDNRIIRIANMLNRGYMMQLLKGVIDLELEKIKERYTILEQKDCYALKDKKTNKLITPYIFDKKYFFEEVVLKVAEAKEIIRGMYLLKDSNGKYGLINSGKYEIELIYDKFYIEGKQLIFENKNKKNVVNITLKQQLEYYLRIINDKNIDINTSNLVLELNKVIQENNDTKLINENNYEIINEHVILFKFDNEIIICDLNSEKENLIKLGIYCNNYEVLNNQVILFKDRAERHDVIYDMKEKKYIEISGEINKTCNANILLNDENFYDIRNSFLIGSSAKNEAYSFYKNNKFLIIKDKVFYCSKVNKKCYIYDINTGENIKLKEDESFELKELNIKYDFENNMFVCTSKTGQVLLNHIRSILEIDECMALKLGIDISILGSVSPYIKETLYLINGKVYYLYENSKGTTVLNELPRKTLIVDFLDGEKIIEGQADLEIDLKIENEEKQYVLKK